MKLASNRQYMITAFRDWLNDQNCTPQIIVDTNVNGVKVPDGFAAQDGRLCLDISSKMVLDYKFDRSCLHFRAQFKGQMHNIVLPLQSILSINCKENSWATWFSVFDDNNLVSAPKPPPSLRVEE